MLMLTNGLKRLAINFHTLDCQHPNRSSFVAMNALILNLAGSTRSKHQSHCSMQGKIRADSCNAHVAVSDSHRTIPLCSLILYT